MYVGTGNSSNANLKRIVIPTQVFPLGLTLILHASVFQHDIFITLSIIFSREGLCSRAPGLSGESLKPPQEEDDGRQQEGLNDDEDEEADLRSQS